ncbi:MAG: gliding motility protein GldN [Bacteroidota bacterium]
MSILNYYKLVASSALLFVGSVAFAQNSSMTDPQIQSASSNAVKAGWKPSLVRDGVADKVPHINAVVPWQPIREVDIMWLKKVWREIDSREKQNVVFRFPGDETTGGGMFIELLINAIKVGKVKAYSNFDDRFTEALTKDQVMEMLTGKSDTLYVEDPITGQQVMKVTRRDFNPDAVTKFRVKEEVYFDRNVGRMVTRIIGLAPYMDKYNEDGSYRASQAMFWLYYPELRETLVQYEVFNPENDVARMTWEDYFEGRFFSSRIVKVSNPFDASFRELNYTNMEQLYEGQRTAEQVFNKEHDMWVY